jgi:hypothetical protein
VAGAEKNVRPDSDTCPVVSAPLAARGTAIIIVDDRRYVALASLTDPDD